MSKITLTTSDTDDSDISQEKQKYIGNSGLPSNSIYFYNDVNNETSVLLNKAIDDLSKQLLIYQINYDLPITPHINLYINSDGGELFGALSIIDRIKSSKVPIHSYVEGLVASASTLISISCHKRYIRRNSIMLVHQLRSWFSGTHDNFKDENKNLDILAGIVKKTYLDNTKFDEKYLEELLKHDIYLNAEECVKFGLADEIK